MMKLTATLESEMISPWTAGDSTVSPVGVVTVAKVTLLRNCTVEEGKLVYSHYRVFRGKDDESSNAWLHFVWDGLLTALVTGRVTRACAGQIFTVISLRPVPACQAFPKSISNISNMILK